MLINGAFLPGLTCTRPCERQCATCVLGGPGERVGFSPVNHSEVELLLKFLNDVIEVLTCAAGKEIVHVQNNHAYQRRFDPQEK